MSSKTSLFLTKDNEHCYEEGNEPLFQITESGTKFVGYTIVLEMSKCNINIICNDDEDLIIEIIPGCELYNNILKMKE